MGQILTSARKRLFPCLAYTDILTVAYLPARKAQCRVAIRRKTDYYNTKRLASEFRDVILLHGSCFMHLQIEEVWGGQGCKFRTASLRWSRGTLLDIIVYL